jgi:hypothetical protein
VFRVKPEGIENYQMQAFRVPPSGGIFRRSKIPTKVGTLNTRSFWLLSLAYFTLNIHNTTSYD